MAAEATGSGAEQAQRGRAGRLAGGIVLVAGMSLAIVWGGRIIEARQMPADRGTAVTGPRLAPAARGDALPDEQSSASARTVDDTNSEQVARDRFSGLERAAPREPLGPSVLAAVPPKATPAVVPPAPDPGTPRPTLLFGAVATAAGRIEAVGHVIELDGVAVVDPARQCEGQGGTWPCGAVARSAFRAWLRGRAVECTVTPQPLPTPVLSLCRLGGKDMAGWLVANGLAEAKPGGAYEQAGQEARAARRGIFGDRPRALPVPAPIPSSAFAADAPEAAAPFPEAPIPVPVQPAGSGGAEEP